MQNDNELQREADEAVRVLKEGGIILYPTDTVWGLGCDATNAEAHSCLLYTSPSPRDRG